MNKKNPFDLQNHGANNFSLSQNTLILNILYKHRDQTIDLIVKLENIHLVTIAKKTNSFQFWHKACN